MAGNATGADRLPESPPLLPVKKAHTTCLHRLQVQSDNSATVQGLSDRCQVKKLGTAPQHRTSNRKADTLLRSSSVSGCLRVMLARHGGARVRHVVLSRQRGGQIRTQVRVNDDFRFRRPSRGRRHSPSMAGIFTNVWPAESGSVEQGAIPPSMGTRRRGRGHVRTRGHSEVGAGIRPADMTQPGDAPERGTNRRLLMAHAVDYSACCTDSEAYVHDFAGISGETTDSHVSAGGEAERVEDEGRHR